MHLKIYHRTEYRYDIAVHHSIQELRLIPASLPSQEVLKWQVYAPSKLAESIDAFGNFCHTFVMDGNYDDLIIESEGEVKTKNSYEFTDLKNSVSPYYLLQQTPLTLPTSEMIDFFSSNIQVKPSPDSMLALANAIRHKIQYQSGITNSSTSASQAFELETGVCQDQSHVFLGIARHFGIPARYVSGYLYVESLPNLASHAWVDVCVDIDQAKWISIDVTHGDFVNEQYVRIAVGRDYLSAAPVKGVRSGGGGEELHARIMIERLN
jgi:transglutaminase-like putative cysteine protease